MTGIDFLELHAKRLKRTQERIHRAVTRALKFTNGGIYDEVTRAEVKRRMGRILTRANKLGWINLSQNLNTTIKVVE